MLATFQRDYPIHVSFPVAWGEMDALGHVNNVVYFRYFENARIALFDHLPMGNLRGAHGIGPILAETRCRFRRPVTFPDNVCVGARVSRIESDRAWIEHAVHSEQLAMVAALGEALVVCYDYDRGAKTPWPADILAVLERLAGMSAG